MKMPSVKTSVPHLKSFKTLTPSLKMPRMNNLLKGQGQHIIDANIHILKTAGYSHPRAIKTALAHATKMGKPTLMKPKMPKY